MHYLKCTDEFWIIEYICEINGTFKVKLHSPTPEIPYISFSLLSLLTDLICQHVSQCSPEKSIEPIECTPICVYVFVCVHICICMCLCMCMGFPMPQR